jgi:anti-sigma regulatory factor (Ser/Thr protein kinase)
MAIAERAITERECSPMIWESKDDKPIEPRMLSLIRGGVKECVSDFSDQNRVYDVLTAVVEAVNNCITRGFDSRIVIRVEVMYNRSLSVCIVAQSHETHRPKIMAALRCAIRRNHARKHNLDVHPDCQKECGRGFLLITEYADKGVFLNGKVLTMRFSI